MCDFILHHPITPFIHPSIHSGSFIHPFMIISPSIHPSNQDHLAIHPSIYPSIQDHLSKLVYMSDVLTSLPFQVHDEPLFVIHQIDLIVSVYGSNVLQQFIEVILIEALFIYIYHSTIVSMLDSQLE